MKIKLCSLLWAFAALFVASACEQEGETGTTMSGYEYELVVDEEGPTPEAGQYVFYDYAIAVNDSVLDQSFGTPQRPRFMWQEPEKLDDNKSPFVNGLRLASAGDSLVVYFPVDSLPNNQMGLPSGDMIEYRLKVTEIMDEQAYQDFSAEEQKEMEAQKEAAMERLQEVASKTETLLQKYKAGELEDSLQTTDSGLKYIVHKEGEGAVPESGDQVFTHYYGRLVESGEHFDDSYSKGVPFRFQLDQRMVIPGWDEGFKLFPRGSRVTMFIPHELAYGEGGYPDRIPERAELMFYVETLDQ